MVTNFKARAARDFCSGSESGTKVSGGAAAGVSGAGSANGWSSGPERPSVSVSVHLIVTLIVQVGNDIVELCHASLDGTLSVFFVGYDPNVGDSFEVMTFASKTGAFSNLNVPCLPGGNIVQVSVSATNVVVSVPGGVLADINCDCALTSDDVDAFVLALVDPVAYAAMFPNCNINVADLNGDTLINGLDTQPFMEAFVP